MMMVGREREIETREGAGDSVLTVSMGFVWRGGKDTDNKHLNNHTDVNHVITLENENSITRQSRFQSRSIELNPNLSIVGLQSLQRKKK